MNTEEAIKQCLVDLDRDCVIEHVEKALSSGMKAIDIVLGPLSDGMKVIGELFEKGEYFIAELLEAANIFKEVMALLEPQLRVEEKSRGRSLTIVIGTVKGDIHDIGKNIVIALLRASGHKVIDLGVDVDAKTFIEAVKTHKAHVLGMSALLTTTARYMKNVIDELVKEGLRDKVFVIIGGAATTPELAKEIGADAWARNAVEAVKIVNEFAKKLYGRRDNA